MSPLTWTLASSWSFFVVLCTTVPIRSITTIVHLNWTSTSPMFVFSKDNEAIAGGRMGIGDILVFECPYTDLDKNQTQEEYSLIYDVTEEEMHDCVLRDDSRLVGECVEPYRRRSIVYRRGDFTGRLHFMSVSTGTKAGLYNRVGGLCESANMRTSISLEELEERRLEDYVDGEIHNLDMIVAPRPEPRSEDFDDVPEEYEGMNDDQVLRAHRINHIQRIGKVIDIGRYEGPPLTQEQWRNAFAKSYQVDQPLTAEDLDPMVRSKFRFFSTPAPEVEPESREQVKEQPLLPDVPYFKNRRYDKHKAAQHVQTEESE